MKKPGSIRFRTAVVLSLGVTLLWLAMAAVTSRMLTSEMSEVFDSALQETGQRILQLAVLDVLSREEEGLTQHIAALDAH
jgi:two-component system, OmpR family, sensor kinase